MPIVELDPDTALDQPSPAVAPSSVGNIVEIDPATQLDPITAQPALSVFGTQLPEPEPSLGEKAKTFVTESARSLDDTMRMLGGQASFGAADEITAGVNAFLGIGEGKTFEERFDSNLAEEMSRDEAIREREPRAALTAEIIGGIGGALAGGSILGAAPGAAAAVNAVKNVPTAIKLGTIGTAAGGLSGALNARPGERTSGAIFGAGLGLALGGVVIPLAKAGVSATIRKFTEGNLGKNVRVAAQKILKALRSDELTPDEAFRRVVALGPKGRLVDVGQNTQRLGRAVAGEPGRASKVATDVLDARQAGQGSRVTAAVNRAIDPTNDFAGTADDLMRIRKDAAAPLYTKAYSKPVDPGEDMISLFRRPAMRQAWVKARKIAANDGDPLPDNLFTTRPDGGEIVNTDAIRDVKMLDYIKRGLDDVVEPHRDPITGKIKTNAGRGVDNLRKEYLRILDKLSPDYKAARASWAGPSRSLELMDKGRRFARADEEITARQIERMTPDEKFFFRVGAARELRDTIYKTPDGADAVKRIFGSKLKRDRMRGVFPDDASFKTFRDAMEQESQLYGTRAIVSPGAGSQTQLRQADAAALSGDIGSGAVDLATGNPGNAATRFVRALFGKNAEGLTPAQSETLAKALFTNDPEVNRQIVRALSVQRMLEGLDPAFSVGAAEAGRQSGAAITR